ncbi:MAG: hypothetical protein WAL15_12790, partial [Xanthobacteraceae bacterium]
MTEIETPCFPENADGKHMGSNAKKCRKNRQRFRLRETSVPPRRFPPPWTAEVTPNCFIVRDANGQA